MIYRVERKENPFVQVDKGLILDENLSFKAKGILLYFLSKPADWNFYEEEIAQHSKDGITSVRAGIAELIENKYIERRKLRSKGNKFAGYEYVVHEEPFLENPKTESPKTEIPISGNLTLLNNKSTNNDGSNNDDIKPSCRNCESSDDEIKPKKEKKVFDRDSNPHKLARLLAVCIQDNKPDASFPESTIQSWADEIDKLIRLDKAKVDDIAEVIQWCQKDDFWKANILSGKKLRKHFLGLSIKLQK